MPGDARLAPPAVDSNPYSSPTAEPTPQSDQGERRDGPGLSRCITQGAVVAVCGSFPLAAIIALLFRFPVPFAGYQSGPDGMIAAMIGAAFYGALGGVVVQAMLGGASGIAAYGLGRGKKYATYQFSVAFGLVAALPGLLFLAVLDWIIGPW
jgi:hypothetical protein